MKTGKRSVCPRVLLLALAGVCAAHAAGLKYWVEPCARPAENGVQERPIRTWRSGRWRPGRRHRAASSPLERTADKSKAIIRIYWESGRAGLYGETRGGDVYVRPDPGEGLLREATVYLTCLHETGHALGLSHTANFEDIMYNFQYGGDISEYFARYVRKLVRREDIRKYSGISPNDQKRLAAGL